MNDVAERRLISLIAALAPYADAYILIGGWVPWLYRKYGNLNWGGGLSGTTELDVVLAPTIEAAGRRPLKEILECNGLEPVSGANHGAVWVYASDQADALELFTPWTGPAIGHQTRRVEGQPGIDVIRLQNLELVTEFVSPLQISNSAGTLAVKVPTLGAYVATKALTFTARPIGGPALDASTKRGKDLLYVFDVMSAGPLVHRRIEADLMNISRRGAPFIGNLHRAGNNLTLLTGKRPHPALAEAAAALSERDSRSLVVAEALIRGAADDLQDFLGEALKVK